ncbi:MAG: endolytic transglycosylase MltG [Patescibacteria group bacterium]|jgi:UPF0755 protein
MKKLSLIIGLFCILLGLGAVLFIPAALLTKPAANAPVITVEIPEGSSIKDISRILVERKILGSMTGYRLYAKLDDVASKAKAGTYEIAFGSSYRQIARMLSVGPARAEATITVVEGRTIADLMEELSKMGATVALGDFAADRYRVDHPVLNDIPANGTLEGYLFPDTYRVWKDQLPVSLIEKQLVEFDDQTNGFREEAEKQGRSFYDVMILASIVEKEARHDEDRPIVAGIFLNRIKGGMRLQSDATLNYVIRSGRSRLTNEDLQNPSPYNTYMHDGLPPGPIGNPGLESIKAALNPAKTEYYFFLTDDKGKTYYARNLEEHIQNRYKAYGE